MSEERKIIVKQTRSVAGRSKRVRDTMRALGLGTIGSERQHSANPAVLGMLRKVEHLVKVYAVN